MNYFSDFLESYLKDNKFALGVDYNSGEQIVSDGKMAAQIFEDYRKEGLDVTDSISLAIKAMFDSSVGLSRYEIIEDCLLNILGNEDLTTEEQDSAMETAVTHDELFENLDRLRYGLDPYDYKVHRNEIIGKCAEIFIPKK